MRVILWTWEGAALLITRCGSGLSSTDRCRCRSVRLSVVFAQVRHARCVANDRAGLGAEVFISRTSEVADFPSPVSYADAAGEAVATAGMVAVDMRRFAAADRDPATHVQECVQRCAIYVGLIGFKRGSRVPGPDDVSYTELEFQAATGKIPRLVFLLREPPPDGIDIDQDRSAIDHFRRRLINESGLIVRWFSTPDELKFEVLNAIRTLPPRPVRNRRAGFAASRARIVGAGVAVAVALMAVIVVAWLANAGSLTGEQLGTRSPSKSTPSSNPLASAAGTATTSASAPATRSGVQTAGRIISPTNGQQVDERADVVGEITTPLPAGHQLWILVGFPDGGAYFPANDDTPNRSIDVATDGIWSEGAIELGDDKQRGASFDLVLVDAGPRGVSQLDAYFDHQDQTGDYLGIDRNSLADDITTLDHVIVRRRS